MQIRKIMQTDVATLQHDEPLIDAVETTASERIRHIPVLEGSRLVGIISATDIKHATPSPLLEGNQADYRKILHGTPVSRIMRRSPITASPDDSLGTVVRLMVDNKIGAILIVEGEQLVGIVSELDILRTYLQVLEVIE
ncbi:MAG: CBS domain-containing protein [Candidatus Brocadiae bacterium]|nr:CBS domain-containing protein [Candidatus Brocadiia bacterium]